MFVRCVSNNIKCVDPQSAIGRELRQSVRTPGGALDLTVGRTYTVYAIAIRNCYPWYFVADDYYDEWSSSYPQNYAAAFFVETDVRVSSCWTVGFRGANMKVEGMREVLFTFKEWANDEVFYERLFDGNKNDIQLFQKYKKFMDMEYPLSSVTDTAELVHDNWLMCPKCIDAWESDSVLGMVRCPKCSTTFLNPRYSPSVRMPPTA